jgi:hypothetical protein
VNEYVGMLLDLGGSETWPVASAALAIVVGGVILAVFKRYLAGRDEARRLERLADDEGRKRVETAIAGLGLQLATEREERRADINKESDVRRDKDDALGRDLVKGLNAIQNAFSYYCGKMDEKRPKFDD